mmetsp:Transcript_38790/g.124344  ORF Transcript_38790/g.124344 Transcript_38790/m.124344 type:complete len:209 (-) Transcript_38790:880-1506(-)
MDSSKAALASDARAASSARSRRDRAARRSSTKPRAFSAPSWSGSSARHNKKAARAPASLSSLYRAKPQLYAKSAVRASSSAPLSLSFFSEEKSKSKMAFVKAASASKNLPASRQTVASVRRVFRSSSPMRWRAATASSGRPARARATARFTATWRRRGSFAGQTSKALSKEGTASAGSCLSMRSTSPHLAVASKSAARTFAVGTSPLR